LPSDSLSDGASTIRMVEVFALGVDVARDRLPELDRNGWWAAVADDMADVLACAGCPRLPGAPPELRYLNQPARTFRVPGAS
jgi:hypothetical protein